MWCEQCLSVMVRNRFYDVLDDSGRLSFSTWRCTGCGRVVEEITTIPQRRNGQPQRVRYAVQPCEAP